MRTQNLWKKFTSLLLLATLTLSACGKVDNPMPEENTPPNPFETGTKSTNPFAAPSNEGDKKNNDPFAADLITVNSAKEIQNKEVSTNIKLYKNNLAESLEYKVELVSWIESETLFTLNSTELRKLTSQADNEVRKNLYGAEYVFELKEISDLFNETAQNILYPDKTDANFASKKYLTARLNLPNETSPTHYVFVDIDEYIENNKSCIRNYQDGSSFDVCNRFANLAQKEQTGTRSGKTNKANLSLLSNYLKGTTTRTPTTNSDSDNEYYNVHNEIVNIDYYARVWETLANPSGAFERVELLNNPRKVCGRDDKCPGIWEKSTSYQSSNNLNDPKVYCHRNSECKSGDIYRTYEENNFGKTYAVLPSINLGSPKDHFPSEKWRKFKVFIPKGTISFSFKMLVKQHSPIKSVVRFWDKPSCANCNNPNFNDFTAEHGTNILFWEFYNDSYFRVSDGQVQPYNKHIGSADYEKYPNAPYPYLEEGGWFYVNNYNAHDDFEFGDISIKVNKDVYLDWYNNYDWTNDPLGLNANTFSPESSTTTADTRYSYQPAQENLNTYVPSTSNPTPNTGNRERQDQTQPNCSNSVPVNEIASIPTVSNVMKNGFTKTANNLKNGANDSYTIISVPPESPEDSKYKVMMWANEIQTVKFFLPPGVKIVTITHEWDIDYKGKYTWGAQYKLLSLNIGKPEAHSSMDRITNASRIVDDQDREDFFNGRKSLRCGWNVDGNFQCPMYTPLQYLITETNQQEVAMLQTQYDKVIKGTGVWVYANYSFREGNSENIHITMHFDGDSGRQEFLEWFDKMGENNLWNGNSIDPLADYKLGKDTCQ